MPVDMTTLPEPLVTILVPTYARADYAAQAVQSALAQSYCSVEVVVLDDASPDDTPKRMAAFIQNPRFHYVRHEENLGITGNWHYGISHARGEYFCLLHDDDILEPNFVRELLGPLLEKSEVALTFSDHWMVDASGHRLPSEENTARFGRDMLKPGRLSNDVFAQAVLVDFSVPVGATLFRRAAVDPNFLDVRAQGAIDYWLLYQIVKTGSEAFYLPSKLMNYRVHGGGMSTRSTMYMAEGHHYRFNAILADSQFTRFHSGVAAQRRTSQISYGIDLVQSGRRAEARTVLWAVLLEQPTRRALIAFVLSWLGRSGSWLVSKLRTPIA